MLDVCIQAGLLTGNICSCNADIRLLDRIRNQRNRLGKLGSGVNRPVHSGFMEKVANLATACWAFSDVEETGRKGQGCRWPPG